MSTRKIYHYSPSLVSVKLFGLSIDGFSPDSVVDIERLEGATVFKKAMDGSRTAVVDKFGTYKVTVSLMQSSPSNTWLHLLYKTYQKLGVEFKMPIIVEDDNGVGGTKFFATDVFFDEEPSSHFGSGAENAVWSFICHDGNYTKKGTVETYDLVEKLEYLMTALNTAQALGLDINDLADATEVVMTSVNNKIQDLFNW